MTIEPVYRREWSERTGEYQPDDEVVGYQALAPTGAVLGTGETIADCIEDALRERWAEYVQKSRDSAD